MKNKRSSNKKKGRGGKKSGGGHKSNDGSSSGSSNGAKGSAAAAPSPPAVVDDAESTLLTDLRSRTRSLFAAVRGCAPDGSPLAQPNHPLARLHASVVGLTDELTKLQSDRSREKAELAGTPDGHNANNRCNGRDDPRTWEEFSAWLKECGVDPVSRDFPVQIRETTTTTTASSSDGGGAACSKGYGLFATRDLTYDETVLEIPVEAMLCPYFDHLLDLDGNTGPTRDDGDGDEQGDNSATPTSSRLGRRAPRPPPFDASRSKDEDEGVRPLCLVTFIANERWRGGRSSCRPYLDILPTTYASTPLFWKVDEIRELARTSHLKRVVTLQALTMWEYLQMRDMIAKAHQQRREDESIVRDLIPVEDFTYELFRWATVTAHTRQNLIPFSVSSSLIARPDTGEDSREIQTAYGLVPLWDMLNHEDSDRACVTAVAVVGDDAGGGESEAKDRPRQGVLVCRTPSKQSDADAAKEEDGAGGDDGICFRRGDEVTMYYGERSNAQLLFHSGFLNGDEKLNRNRTDSALLRVALPTAERDAGLDRIREMVAAKFGFNAYVDQGCRHDGMLCADAAASLLGHCSDGEADKLEQNGTLRKRAETVMAEFSVSPRDPCPDDLKRALLLCVGNKDELAHLLRHMDRYVESRPASSGTGDTSGTVNEAEPLQLGGKHFELAQKLVNIQNDRSETSERSLGDRKSASGGKLLAADLACCDSITLNSWLAEFRPHCVPHTIMDANSTSYSRSTAK